MSQSGTQSSTAVSETTGTEKVQTTEAETVIEPEPVVAPAENLSETVQQIPPLGTNFSFFRNETEREISVSPFELLV